MKIDYYASSLVIVGGWNPNIINPHWIRKNLLDQADLNDPNQEKVNINIQMDTVSSVRRSPMVASFREIKITFTDNRLDLGLSEGSDFTLLEKYALKIYNHLPNTPVTAYGMNLVFTDEKNSENLVNIVNVAQSKNFDTPLTFEQYNFSLELDGIKTNITIDIKNKDGRSGFRFNFHFDIDDLSKFKSGISENSMHTLREKAVKIISDVYGLRLED